MFIKKILTVALLFCLTHSYSQREVPEDLGRISVGVRSTISYFDHDGVGLGTGGQFRVQLSHRVNTDWFADYISINSDDEVRSTYYHVGWSVLFYPMNTKRTIQPYILAGHCFDYNEKTQINDPENTKNRWGSAVQGGLGIHWWLTDRFDVSLITQMMVHLTKEIELETLEHNDDHTHEEEKVKTLESHMLTTVSLNYTLGDIWKR